MKLCIICLALLLVAAGCNQQSDVKKLIRPAVASDSCSLNFDIDTIRFPNNLTQCQKTKLFYRRNLEEDYNEIDDTARVALRFIWWRSFHGLTIIRLENRPIIYLSDFNSNRKIWQEWFATYKKNIQRLNTGFTIEKGNKYWGRIPPFVFQQSVQVLPANNTPSVIAALDSIGFWNMKKSYPDSGHTDGSSWTLEVYRNGRYHEVTTNLREHPIKNICLQILRLSKYPAEENEIY